MKRFISVLFFVLFLPAAGVEAQQVTAEKLWFGEYKSGETKEIDDPKSPTGKRYEFEGQAQVTFRTDTIKLRQDMKFGLGYLVRGPRGNIEVEHFYFLPDDNGRGSTNGEPAFRLKTRVTSGEATSMGWNIGADHDLSLTKLGTYIFQVRYQDRVLAEQWFNVQR